jgi:hypothetical protein
MPAPPNPEQRAIALEPLIRIRPAWLASQAITHFSLRFFLARHKDAIEVVL